MGRKAFVTSDISTDEEVIQVGIELPIAPLLWSLLITSFDDWGRAEASAVRIKARVFPMFEIVTIPDIERTLILFAEKDIVTLYEVNGKRYMAIHPEKWFSFQTHIRMEKRRKDESKIPPCAAHRAWFDNQEVAGPDSTDSDEGKGNSRAIARESATTREPARVRTPSPSPSPSPTPTAAAAGGLGGNAPAQIPTAEPPGEPPRSASPLAAAAADAYATGNPEGEGPVPPVPALAETPPVPIPEGNPLLPLPGENPCGYVRRVLPALPRHWPPELNTRYRMAATSGKITSEWAWKRRILEDWLNGAEPPPEAPPGRKVVMVADPVPPLPRGGPVDASALAAKFGMPGDNPSPGRNGLTPPPMLDKKTQEEARQREAEQVRQWLANLPPAERSILTAEVEAEVRAMGAAPGGRMFDRTVAQRLEARALTVVRMASAERMIENDGDEPGEGGE